MNEIVNNFLLVWDKFMPEMHLKQTGFTSSACRPFTKNKERIEKFMQTGNLFIKWTWKSLLPTWYGLWQIKRFSKKKNTIR